MACGVCVWRRSVLQINLGGEVGGSSRVLAVGWGRVRVHAASVWVGWDITRAT